MNQKINCIYSWAFTQSWVKNETSYSNNGCYTKSWNESANAHLSLSVAKSYFLDTLHEIVYSSFHKLDFFKVRLFLRCHWFHHFCWFFKKVSSNKLCLAPVYLLPANVQVMMYFSQSCRAIIYDKMSINFLSKLTQPIYRPLEICMDLQNVNGFYFKIWAILYTEIYVLLILDQTGPSTLFRY